MPCDNFRFGRQRLESEGTTDEPQRTHFLFSRTYACRIGRLLQWATSQRSQESRDRAGQNPGKGPPSGFGRGGGRRDEFGWTFRKVTFGTAFSLGLRLR